MRNVCKYGKTLLVMITLVFAVIAGLPSYSLGQSPAVEPKADQLLQEMSAYLTGLEQFGVETENTIDAVLRSGKKIQFDNPAQG
jgi:hypothetical protein